MKTYICARRTSITLSDSDTKKVQEHQTSNGSAFLHSVVSFVSDNKLRQLSLQSGAHIHDNSLNPQITKTSSTGAVRTRLNDTNSRGGNALPDFDGNFVAIGVAVSSSGWFMQQDLKGRCPTPYRIHATENQGSPASVRCSKQTECTQPKMVTLQCITDSFFFPFQDHSNGTIYQDTHGARKKAIKMLICT